MNNITTVLNSSQSNGGSKKTPFTRSERDLLIALVRERPIIENKRFHAKNIELKSQAWEDLTVAYNALPFVSQRTKVQLKRCWENIKMFRKKELSQEAMQMKCSGGGPPLGDSSLSSDNIVDTIHPFINLPVPGLIDSNSIENVNVVPSIEHLNIVDTSNKNGTDHCDVDIKVEDTRFDEQKETTPLNTLKRKMDEESIGSKRFLTEAQVRINRCTKNMENDEQLHLLRVQKEKILIFKEQKLMSHEEEFNKLQIEKIQLENEKLKLEIEILKKKL